MFPVCTGIHRWCPVDTVAFLNVPCMHRDTPDKIDSSIKFNVCSLYAQGYTVLPVDLTYIDPMFPVCTGIHRVRARPTRNVRHVPCMHRDTPHTNSRTVQRPICSLYAQGYTANKHNIDPKLLMFPVCTGIHRASQWFTNYC